MKKRKIISLTLIAILSITLILGCSIEKDQENIALNGERRLNVKISNWDHLIHEHKNVADLVDKFRQKNFTNKSSNTDDLFYIDENRVQIIENEGYTTYTFFVWRDA